MNFKKIFTLLLSASVLTISCSKPEKTISTPQPDENKKGVFICNEGNFMSDNSSLSFYNPETKNINNNIFYNTNKVPLGDVTFSMTIRDTIGYIVVNNSGHIYAISTNSFKALGTIKGLTSPRYMKVFNETKAYVTDISSNSITIINPQNYSVTGYINVEGTTEEIAQIGDYAYVTNWSYGNKLYKIDIRTDKLVATLEVPLQPSGVVADKNGKLWVLSDGSYEGSPVGYENSYLTKVDPTSFTIEKSLKFKSLDSWASKLTINATGDMLYYIDWAWGSEEVINGAYKMSINDEELPSQPFIKGAESVFYALGINPANNDLYISHTPTYGSPGEVIRYDAAGQLLDRVVCDINPGNFSFTY